jgi:hypothetical protein
LARLRPRLQRQHARQRWLRRALAAAAVLATPATLVGLWPAYHALGPVAPPQANLIVKLRPGVDAQAARQHWPEGVTEAGVTATDGWLLAVPPAQREQALARLRADPLVELAEPLDMGAPR